MSKLTGKTALITGGNSGIGFATAQEFIAQGAKVIITGRRADAVAEAVAQLGGKAHGIVNDVADVSALPAFLEEVKKLTPSLDVIFINAGIAEFAPIGYIDEGHFDRQFNTNVKGALFITQTLLPLINDGGSILFNASVAAGVGMPNSAVYAATKAALITITKVIAGELAPRKIRVNSISPGPINTPIYGKTGMPEADLNAFAGTLINAVPLKRFAEASEIATIASFLASNESSYITGQDIIVDGGVAINPVVV